ncbi:hypothetical protein [Tenacibaculum ovolyticum]|uniref:hypothetical protein n=1 Tax=Tenacibaculum ovolyticum TaxID=104270 RepID=UPI000414CE69|nr:hypothetical protein [Tenacibaculum ovolyticum]
MYLFYVYGAGLGHLNRIQNFIYTQKIPLNECVVLTNSSFCDFISKSIKVIHKKDSYFKGNNFSVFFLNEIKINKITTVVVDVFPAGFYGELERLFVKLKGVKTILLSRILKKSYFDNYKCPKYDIIYILEKGISLDCYKGNKFINLGLKERNKISENDFLTIEKPYFLILHSNPIEEVLLLYEQALLYRTNEHIYIQTYSNIDISCLERNSTLISNKKANVLLLENANKIFTGCGFNSVMEIKKYKKKQYIIPFKRKYDDQFKRMKNWLLC